LNVKTPVVPLNFQADGLSITAAEPWFKVKVQLVQRYLQAFIMNAAAKADEIIFVDAFSGSGLYSTGHQKAIFPSVALATLAGDLPIHRWIFCERDPEQAYALQARVKKTILFVSHDLDEALRLGDRISIMQNGRIIQTGTAEEIVLTPADDYVAEFVLHMNPLTVLTGSMVMQRRAHLAGDGTEVWLDPGRRYQLSLNSTGEALSLTMDGLAHTLRYIRDEVDIALDEPGLTIAPASMSLQAIIQLRQNSGHPVLVAEDGKILGVCGEHEIIRALSRGKRM